MNGFIDWQGQCPYCGEIITLYIDPDNNDSDYIEDCSVCCRPISVSVAGVFNEGECRVDNIELRAEND